MAKHSQNSRQSSFSSCEHQECSQVSQPLGSFNRGGGKAAGHAWFPQVTNSFWMKCRDNFFYFFLNLCFWIFCCNHKSHYFGLRLWSACDIKMKQEELPAWKQWRGETLAVSARREMQPCSPLSFKWARKNSKAYWFICSTERGGRKHRPRNPDEVFTAALLLYHTLALTRCSTFRHESRPTCTDSIGLHVLRKHKAWRDPKQIYTWCELWDDVTIKCG